MLAEEFLEPTSLKSFPSRRWTSQLRPNRFRTSHLSTNGRRIATSTLEDGGSTECRCTTSRLHKELEMKCCGGSKIVHPHYCSDGADHELSFTYLTTGQVVDCSEQLVRMWRPFPIKIVCCYMGKADVLDMRIDHLFNECCS